ncbi:MAG: low-complexity tail membrane protein, partial [Cyanobacteria bacterium J06635_13]
MKTRSELFLWIHLGGIVMFPLFLVITLVGLCTGERYSYVIELSLLVLIAIVPILLMQLYRPFNIFSVLFLSLKPENLTENQRKILVRFQTKQQKLL